MEEFLNAVQWNADRIRSYKSGASGAGGESDCIGLIIGALAHLGYSWPGIHGTNWTVRSSVVCNRDAPIHVGQLRFKSRAPGQYGYSLPASYKTSPDQTDYYHVGVVQSVSPLRIIHCSSGGIHIDKTLGRWTVGLDPKMVDQSEEARQEEGKGDDNMTRMIIDVPSGSTVNVRASKSGKILAKWKEGTSVDVIQVDGEWAEVVYQRAYIMKKFLKEAEQT